MPNDCENHITITADREEIDRLIRNEFMVGETDLYLDRVNVYRRGRGAIELNMCSAWAPDFNWLAGLVTKYPSCWVKNKWCEEGGNAGVWIGYTRDGAATIQRMEWDDMCLEECADRFSL